MASQPLVQVRQLRSQLADMQSKGGEKEHWTLELSANGTRQLDRWPTPVKFASKVLIMYKSICCTYILFSRFIFFHSISVLNELVTQFLEASKICPAIQVNYLNHCSVGHPYIYIYIYIYHVWGYGSKLLTSNVIGGMGPNRRIKMGTPDSWPYKYWTKSCPSSDIVLPKYH